MPKLTKMIKSYHNKYILALLSNLFMLQHYISGHINLMSD